MVSKTELEAIENFRNATKALKRASADMETNVGLRTILLKKEEGLQKLEDIILGNGIRRDILNFIILKKEQRRQRKEAGLSRQEFKELRKREKQRKKELERAKRAKELQEQQEQLTREMFGDAEAERIINERRAENLAQTIERDMILAEAEKGDQDREAAERAKAREEEEKAREEEEKKINSLTEAARAIEAAFSGNVGIAFENLSRTIQSFEVSGAIGDVTAGLELVAEQIELQRGDQPTKAEADQERASQEAWKTSQISLLETIALNTMGGGGAGGEGGGEGGSGGGGMGKFGKGIASLGKGIGAFIKAIGKGAGAALKGLAFGFAALGKALIPLGKGIGKVIQFVLMGIAKGVAAFANPATAIGLGLITLAFIGLAAALRIAGPALEGVGFVIESVGMVFVGVIEAISGGLEKIGRGIRSVGAGVKDVLQGVEGVIRGIGDSISGVITSVAEGIATVVKAVKGDAKAEAEAQIAVLNAQTESIQKLSKIDPGTMAATATGIESIKSALSGLGSPSLLGMLGKMFGGGGPIADLLELAKNSQGITDASSALNSFVENAKLFEKGVKVDSSVIKGIEMAVQALGSGDPAGLQSLSNAIESINTLDESKIGLLNKITIPQVMPPTAAEYERIFKAMQSAEPSTIEKVQGFFSNVFGRKPREARQARTPRGAGSAGSVDPATVGQGMAEGDVEGMEGAGMLGSAAKDVSTGGAVAKGKMILTPAQQKKLAMLRRRLKGKTSNNAKKRIERDIRSIERKGRAAYNKSVNPSKKFSGDFAGTSRNTQAAAISSSPPSAGDYGGGPAGGSTMVNNMSAPTTNVNNHTSPMTNRPTSRSAETLRAMKNF